MYAQGGDGDDGAAAAPASHSIGYDLLGHAETTSSQELHSGKQTEAQSHNKNVSGSSSIDFDAVVNGEPSFSTSDESETRSQQDSGIKEGGVNLKGKETCHPGLKQPQELVRAAESSISQSPGEGQVEIEAFRTRIIPVTSQLTGEEGARQHVPAGEFHERYYRAPGIPVNANPSGDVGDSTSSAVTRISSTNLPSFGAQLNTEQDRRNWERIQSIAGSSTSNAVQIPQRVAQKRKSISSDNVRGLDGTGSAVSTAYSGNSRPPPYDENFSSVGNLPQAPRTRQLDHQQSSQEVVVPRWQPDAEVTFCPICATQFSFFVRKHHCRKCGRVVCNACSPHRITIPYQFIVQPPTEPNTSSQPNSHARPALDPARAGSSSAFASLVGGERVRLCNPCVPDPNTAPPQTPQFSNQPQRISSNAHSRSASSTNTYTVPQQPTLSSSNPSQSLAAYYLQNHRRQPRQPSILGRPSNSPNSTSSQAYTTRNNGYADQAYTDPRTRASTVSGGGVRQDQNPRISAVPGSLSATVSGVLSSSGAPAIPGRVSHVPRAEHQTRPLPRVPRPPRIAEEDECPVCHRELPSSQLPDSEALRAAHITNCIDNVMQGTSSTPSPPPPTNSINVPSAPATPSSSTSTPLPVPIANTPEARMAAREQAHAAVVLGQHPSPSPAFRPTGVFPYKATEKDCVDDAECTICLEEFEVGQDMGRLECFCRFHLHCIREWFVNHYGQCPVHHQAY